MSSDIHALSGAYAVDALDDVERADFERHLATCESCRAEVDSLREAAGLIAETATAPPPAPLRDRVLADIGTVRPLAPPTEPRRLAARRRRLTALVAAAAAVVLIAVGGVVWHPWTDDPPQDQVTLADQVVSAPDVERVRTELDDGTVITAYRSASLGRAAITAPDLSPPPDGRVYELWLQDAAGDMRPAGLMDSAPPSVHLLQGRAATAQGLGITVEPAGGSPAPTTDPIALLAFPGRDG